MLPLCPSRRAGHCSRLGMNIEEKIMALSEPQYGFQFWLERNAPQLQSLLNWDDRSVDLDAVESYLATVSHGEAIMCRFFVGVFLGHNDMGFNIIEAAAVLDKGQREVISLWLARGAPRWP
jgi:hypothetical protein